MRAIKARGTKDYGELLAKLPLHVQHHPNILLQYGAQFEFIKFGVRRGWENIGKFKKTDLELQENDIYDFHYYRVVKA